MKYFTTKEQTEKLMELGLVPEVLKLTAYEEILDEFPYDFKNGRYVIYRNLSAGDLLNNIPLLWPHDGEYHRFNLDCSEVGWTAEYKEGDACVMSSWPHDELVDALYDLLCQILSWKPEKEN